MRRLVFLPRAIASLESMMLWSEERFGHQRTIAYRQALLASARKVADGTLSGQSCRAVFAADLLRDRQFVRSGRHFSI